MAGPTIILASLRHCLTSLATITGRTSRAMFWPYVLILVLAVTVAWTAAIVPEILRSVARMQEFAAAHPDQATVVRTGSSYSISIDGHHPELAPDFTHLMTTTGIISIAFVLLVGSAVVRRLRDAGRRGWWALPPLAFLALGLAGMRRLMAGFGEGGPPEFGAFLLLFLNNILYLVTLTILLVQLSRPSLADRDGATT